MKSLLIISALVFLSSCNSTLNEDHLIGSWTTIESQQASKDALTDIITFDDSGRIQVETLLGGSVIEKIKGKYEVDARVLTVIYDTARLKFNIHELTNRSFAARQEGKRTVLRLRKIDE